MGKSSSGFASESKMYVCFSRQRARPQVELLLLLLLVLLLLLLPKVPRTPIELLPLPSDNIKGGSLAELSLKGKSSF